MAAACAPNSQQPTCCTCRYTAVRINNSTAGETSPRCGCSIPAAAACCCRRRHGRCCCCPTLPAELLLLLHLLSCCCAGNRAFGLLPLLWHWHGCNVGVRVLCLLPDRHKVVLRGIDGAHGSLPAAAGTAAADTKDAAGDTGSASILQCVARCV